MRAKMMEKTNFCLTAKGERALGGIGVAQANYQILRNLFTF